MQVIPSRLPAKKGLLLLCLKPDRPNLRRTRFLPTQSDKVSFHKRRDCQIARSSGTKAGHGAACVHQF